MRSLSQWNCSRASRRSLASLTRLRIEELESRWVPYNTSGNLWPNAQLVTISFMPDGTSLGSATSNLFATFNARFGTAATWQNVILKAAQVWAQQTNLNFAVVSDNGAQQGGGSYQQGDPAMGDIRIGGYSFGNSTLAQAFMPPPVNNFSIAGDIQFNTGQTFNINGQDYDLFTVAAHEFGHALGLSHTTTTGAIMNATYGGAKVGLASDDTNGIRNIYSNNNARAADAFGSLNNSFANAANINSYIDTGSLTALVNTMDITAANEKDYYTATAPSGTGSTVTVSVQSQGLSLLAPKLYVYSSSQALLGSASGSGHYGTTVTLNLTNKISAGQQFYVMVQGADGTALGTGAYALTMSFAGNPLPTVPLPNTQLANGSPLSGGGGQPLSTTDDDPRGDTYPASESGPTATNGFTPQVVRFINAASTPGTTAPFTVLAQPGTAGRPAALDALVVASPAAQLSATWISPRAVTSAEDLADLDQFGVDVHPALPATTPARQTEAAEPMQPATSPELSRRDACFADDSWLFTTGSEGTSGRVGADGADLALDPAARVAALAVVLGGGWAVRTERANRDTRTQTNRPRPR